MSHSSTPFFIMLYNSMDVLLIIAVRLFGFAIQVPILSIKGAPTILKIGFVMTTTMLIFFSGIIVEVDYINSFFGFAWLLIQEFTVGFLLGFVVYFFFSIFYMAGQFADYQMGFSMVSVFDPTTQTQVPITGNVLYLVGTAIFVVTGAFNVIIEVLIKSYTLLPIGSANIISNEVITSYLITAVANYLELSVLIAVPIMGTVILVDIAMGLLVKTVPQMNVFVVGAPIKLIVGITVFTLTLPNIPHIFDYLFYEILDMLEIILKGLT